MLRMLQWKIVFIALKGYSDILFLHILKQLSYTIPT